MRHVRDVLPGALGQLSLAATCPRCGSPFIDPAELDRRLAACLDEIDSARMRWPVGVAGEIKALRRALMCQFATCEVQR